MASLFLFLPFLYQRINPLSNCLLYRDYRWDHSRTEVRLCVLGVTDGLPVNEEQLTNDEDLRLQE